MHLHVKLEKVFSVHVHVIIVREIMTPRTVCPLRIFVVSLANVPGMANLNLIFFKKTRRQALNDITAPAESAEWQLNRHGSCQGDAEGQDACKPLLPLLYRHQE